MNKDFTFQLGDEEAPVSSRDDATSTTSPWEFSGYSHTVAEEHLQRKTTSIDHKISQFKPNKLKGDRSDGARHDDHDASEANEANGTSEEEEEDEEDKDLEDEDEGGPEEEVVEQKLDVADHSNFYGEEAGEREQKYGKRVKKNASADERIASRATSRAPSSFFSSLEGATFMSKSFMELNISRPLLRACDALGYKQPTPIQAACIPLALTGRDICGSAVTGSGKTAAFALPLLERLLFRPRRFPAIRVLVLTPTRELAVQVHSMIEKLAQFTDVRCCLVVGGLSSKVQEVGLRTNPDIVIATPGRMIDHLHNTHSVGLEDLAILVLDEADRLLQLGFSNEVHELVRLCPKKRQTMLFSATMTEEVNELVKLSLVNPVRLSADPSTQRPATLFEQVVKISGQHEGDKEAVLLALCSRSFTSKVIIFSGTKVEAHRLKILFGLNGLKAAELHGNLTQAQRLDALEMFRKREADFLIATDVAARGLDIIGVTTVINFECPRDITTYVHRVGRTARAGQEGCAVTFACKQDRTLIKLVAKRAGSKLSNRVVQEGLIMKWHEKIQELEKSIRGILQEERVERALRKAEMEANKAQNMMEYESEIFSRPKKVWFQTPKERKHIANAAKDAKKTGDHINNEKVGSIKNVQNGKNRKRPLEQKKNLTRKTRRRLEAAQEAAEEGIDPKGPGKTGKNSVGQTIAELAYRKAKAAKALEKARESGKLRSIKGVVRTKLPQEKKRKKEMQELFQSDISFSKGRDQSSTKGVSRSSKRKPGISKRSFKSKTRYKRR